MIEQSEARRKVFDTLLKNAIIRPETAVTLGLSLVLFFAVGGYSLFGLFIPAFSWLVLGVIAEAILIMAMMSDPAEAQEAFTKEFQKSHDIGDIRNQVSRERLHTAMEYRSNMFALMEKSRSGARQVRIQGTINQVDDWIDAMYSLAEHIDSFESNHVIEQDFKRVPAQIEKVKTRIQAESDEGVRSDLERQLRLLEQQLSNLEQTRSGVRRAQIQLETTLSSLGTVYAQMSLLNTQGGLGGSNQDRMLDDIQSEVMSLQDTIEALDEVQTLVQGLQS